MRNIGQEFPHNGSGKEGRFFRTELEAAGSLLQDEQLILAQMRGSLDSNPKDIAAQQGQVKAAEDRVKYLREHPEEGAKPLSETYLSED